MKKIFHKFHVGIAIKKVHLLAYHRLNTDDYGPPNDVGEPIAVIYIFHNNSIMKLDLIMYYTHPDLYIPLTVQKGDVFDKRHAPRAPVIWCRLVNASASFAIPIEEEGWYTVSVTGPISVMKGHNPVGVIYEEGRERILLVDLELLIHVSTPEEEMVPFAVNEHRQLNFFP
jgi:hypothetical protein